MSELQAFGGLLVVAATSWALYQLTKPSHTERTEFRQFAEPEMSYRSAFPQPRHFAEQPIYAEAPPSELPPPAPPQQTVSTANEDHRPQSEEYKPTPEDAPSHSNKEVNGPVVQMLCIGQSAVECQKIKDAYAATYT
jgi:hypothetical protein